MASDPHPNLQVRTAAVFTPLLQPARYKGAHGGRGSGKSHFFGQRLVIEAVKRPGLRAVCIREVQKSLAQSSKRLVEDKIAAMGLSADFTVRKDAIETPGGGLILFQGMQAHTAESIKSLEGFDIAWIEEAQSLSARSLTLLRPTIRAEASEIWASWNPRRKTDAIDEFLRQKRPDGAVVVQANWRDNPWFPRALELERRIDQEKYPERYDHIWEGDYARAFEGAYFARPLAEAMAEGRITRLAADPVLARRAFFDLGGSGASADATAVWVAQFVGQAIQVIDDIEGVGQPLGYYAEALRERGHGAAEVVLPHDGVTGNAVTGKRYDAHWREAGFETRVIKNQGKGAAMMRIEAARRLFPRVWFDRERTEAGREALGFYHERRDEARNVGLGPEHDWSSHAADAFGLMCVSYEAPRPGMARLDLPAFGAV